MTSSLNLIKKYSNLKYPKESSKTKFYISSYLYNPNELFFINHYINGNLLQLRIKQTNILSTFKGYANIHCFKNITHLEFTR